MKAHLHFQQSRIAVILCLALSLAACTKDREVISLQDGSSIVVTDLPGDTTASMAGGGGAAFENLYFSFKTNSKVAISGEEKKTDKWDLAFTGPYNSEVYVNSGTYQYNPGYGGPGKGAVIVIDQPYDQVTEAPADAAFNASDLYKIGWDAGNGRGWFFYSLDNHICVPVRNRTFVLRTVDGKYAKLEIINVYKGNPPVVTDLFWPAPYLTFRYYVQQDGSANLRTR
jgi:hypothetical protein